MDESERIGLIGRIIKHRDHLYFPVQLKSGEFNYGIQQGLIHISPIRKCDGEKTFVMGVVSPDDLDIDLHFSKEHTHLRQEIIAYMTKCNKHNVTYKGILREIQDQFNAGELS